MFAYIGATVFCAIWAFLVIYRVVKKTQNIESKKIKTILRFGIPCILVGLWVWHFIYMNLYPISLAYYEYNHNYTEEKIGVIDSIEQKGKDRIYFIIDDKEYIMVDSSAEPFVVIGKDVEKYDAVKFRFGKKSKFIFDIQTLDV